MTTTVLTPPASTYLAFVPLQVAKDFLRVQHTDEDALIEGFIVAAIQMAENMCNVDFVRKTRTVTYSDCDFSFGSGFYRTRRPLRLPFATDVVITGVIRNGDLITISDYDFGSEGFLPNAFYSTRGAAYTVTYESGYVPIGTALADLRQAILQIVASFHQDRTHYTTGAVVANVPLSARVILNQYVRYL